MDNIDVNKGSINVRYLDTNGNEIATGLTPAIKDNIRAPYDVSKFKKDDIYGYNYKETNGDPVS